MCPRVIHVHVFGDMCLSVCRGSEVHLRYGSSGTARLVFWVSLGWSPEIWLSLSQFWLTNIHCHQIFYMVLWIKLRTLCLRSEHFTSWASSPAWDCVFLLLLEPYIFYHIANTPRGISVNAGSSGLLPSGLLSKYLMQGCPWVSPNTFFSLSSHVGFHTSWSSLTPSLCLLPSLDVLCLPITA